MKKKILILVGIFVFASNIKANNTGLFIEKNEIKHRYNNTINFVERGVKFYVFLNGDFDFRHKNMHYNNNRYNRRHSKQRNVFVEKDYNGKIRRVGGVSIGYDYRGNVRRIGTIFIKYKYGNLISVGNLKVHYNRWGEPRFYGKVSRNYYPNHTYPYIDDYKNAYECDVRYFYEDHFRNNYSRYREDTDFYYYKAKPNAKIGDRPKVLKRRKLVSKNTPYRKNRSTTH